VKPITLPGVSKELERVLRKTATETGKSLDRVAIALLERGARLSRRSEHFVHHDLDHLAGTWTKEEADAFDKKLERQRRVDAELFDPGPQEPPRTGA
jgi:hypothetical protein